MIILWGLLALLLLLVMAVNPERSRHSWFELNRRGDELAMRREWLIVSIIGLRRLLAGTLLIALAAIGFSSWQIVGIAATVLVWLLCGPLLRLRTIKKLARRLYLKIEPWLLDTLENMKYISWFVGSDDWKPRDQKLESIEQLIASVESSNILSDEQRNIVLRGLEWHTTPVSKVMTLRKDVVAIKHDELLGPLVLDDLHRSGHGQFPVTKDGLDDVIGILDISHLLEVDAGKRSETAEKAMVAQALRIGTDEYLPVALKLLEKGRQHLLVVVDDQGKTVGIITLSDITRSLLKLT